MSKRKIKKITMESLTKAQKQLIKDIRILLRKSTSGFPTLIELHEVGITRQKIRTHFSSLSNLKEMLVALGFEDEVIMAEEKAQLKTKKQQLIELAISLVETYHRYPTFAELASCGISRNEINTHFGGLNALFAILEQDHPNIFEDLFTTEEFTRANLKIAKDCIKEHEDFMITTAVSGCAVHKSAYDSIVTWENDVGGLTLYQPIADPARPRQGQHMFFDPLLKDDHFIFEDVDINKKIHISSLLISAKQLNPHTGLRSIVDREGLTFVASPKQTLTPLANMKRMPGYLFSPGSVTVSDYNTDMYMSNRTAYISTKKHVLGAAIFRVLGDNKYFCTNVTFDEKTGAFAHLGTLYTPTGTQPISTKYMVLGDLHSEETDSEAFQGVLDAVEFFQPDEIFIHDAVSFCTINPFDVRRPLLVAAAREKLGQSIEDTMQIFMDKLNRLTAVCNSKIFVVRGNHDAFLDMWVEKGSYLKDPVNYKLGHELAMAKLENEDLLAVEYTYNKLKGEDSKVNIVFLNEISSEKRSGVECGQHGRWGSQGSGNPNLAKCVEEFGPCNMGHGHVSEIYPTGGMRAGTLLATEPDRRAKYARKGPSKTSQSFIVGYENGQRQLIHLINSKFDVGEGE